MDLDGKTVLIIGLGRTGVATARFLLERGVRILVADEKPVCELEDAIDALGGAGDVEVGIGQDEVEILSRVDLIVPSPGVPPFNPLLVEGVRRRIPIVSELELASGYVKKPIIAITGTNGKTTTTTLIGEILAHCGKRVFVGGNIGTPFISYVGGRQEDDYVVIEVSSFQLQWVKDFHPYFAMLLNVSCDHLDYHGSLEEYRSVKERIFERQGSRDLAILNADDPASIRLAKRLPAGQIMRFSSSSTLEKGMFVDGESLRYRGVDIDEQYPMGQIRLRGVHNLENVMAAVLAARMCGCPSGGIVDVLNRFDGIAHRIEFAGMVDDVAYYDDSKGTNVDAVYRALQSFPGPVVLLLGGRYKGGDFGMLAQLVRERVRVLIVFGEAAETIAAMIGGIVKTEHAGSLKEAVGMARDSASSGDTVLLSPGCSSFDEFKNYEERGAVFKGIVERMGHQGRKGIWANSLQ
ncbi:MAG: UDP-N-acetylmuramoyl-L-alanine--D-glutamate ligase [Syntrophobacterales bacterium]|nr:MAG: UDP-N-acetylmuramoyl-L-alanine--D-glutamate ligase [Syntrophobacterales bacterium]